MKDLISRTEHEERISDIRTGYEYILGKAEYKAKFYNRVSVGMMVIFWILFIAYIIK